jgi:hypothetical protein
MMQKFQPQKIRRKISLYFGGKKFHFSLKENLKSPKGIYMKSWQVAKK